MKKLLSIACLLIVAANCLAQKTYIQCGKLIDGVPHVPRGGNAVQIVLGDLLADLDEMFVGGDREEVAGEENGEDSAEGDEKLTADSQNFAAVQGWINWRRFHGLVLE